MKYLKSIKEFIDNQRYNESEGYIHPEAGENIENVDLELENDQKVEGLSKKEIKNKKSTETKL